MGVVREKMDDPSYSGWFLQFKDGINGSGYKQKPCSGPAGNTKCTPFWHQLLDEPSCPGNDCDCGQAPCAMYELDHRNESFAKWFVEVPFLRARVYQPRPLGTGGGRRGPQGEAEKTPRRHQDDPRRHQAPPRRGGACDHSGTTGGHIAIITKTS
jgi:hypothetical protein